MTTSDFQQALARIDRAIAALELRDPELRSVARDLMRATLELHAQGLELLLTVLDPDQAARVAGDPRIASMLVLHDLHPVPLGQRIERALEQVRPKLALHGGGVELLGLKDGVASIRLQGSCHGCPSSIQTLKETIEDAVFEAAPDVARIIVEGLDAAEAP